MKKIRVFILSFAIVLMVLSSASALTLKIGSLGPVGTPFDDALKRIAAVWSEISGGSVKVKIYPGGIAGDEADMVRKVRIGQLDGVALSGTGLNRITSEIMALVLPMFFHNLEELEYVMQTMFDDFSGIFEEEGFKLVGLSSSGWVKFFAKKPIDLPADLQAQRLAVSAEDEEILYAWRAMGFDALPVHPTATLAALQTGRVEAFHTPIVISAMYQWFGLAPYMNTMNIAPLLTGFVMGERSWRRVPDRFKEDFIAAGREVMTPLYEEIVELEKEALQVMLDNGLIINERTDKGVAEWDNIVTKGHDILVGTSISPEVYERALALRDEYRRTHE
jgi:TRAP-type transport system periplasmic protein